MEDVRSSAPEYVRPELDILGSFAVDTLSFDKGKWSSFSDLAQGISVAIGDGGIGS